jgi:hypothetical protein
MDNTTLFAGFGKKRKYKKYIYVFVVLRRTTFSLPLVPTASLAQEPTRLLKNLGHRQERALQLFFPFDILGRLLQDFLYERGTRGRGDFSCRTRTKPEEASIPRGWIVQSHTGGRHLLLHRNGVQRGF